jgi:hypothetical protein
MAKTGIPGVIIAFVPPWAKGKKKARGYIFKRYHFPTSAWQKAQQLVLSRAAYTLYDRNLHREEFLANITPSLRTGRGKGPKSTYPKIRSVRHVMSAGTISRLETEVGTRAAPALPA